MDDAAQQIHRALETVSSLRKKRAKDPLLMHASAAIKRFQAARFRASYADLLQSPRHAMASAFFLDELYSAPDYTERDQQFAKIASTIARLFPQSVVDTAATLAEVHALTETLDDAMAREWLFASSSLPHENDEARYVRCWRRVASHPARHEQLELVLHLGWALEKLTRSPGLRGLLRMMRLPAKAAGLDALQRFLERGFDAFAAMHGADEFLKTVESRETQWLQLLFKADAVTCETKLNELLRPSNLY